MFRPRIIPILLLKNNGLVKTVKFKNPRYIGDPINAVKIFNDLKADELIFLDIAASRENRCISSKLIKDIGDEAFMPFAVGGGIKTVEEIKELISSGAEKVVLNTQAFLNIGIIEKAASIFGNQSIIISVDVKRNILGEYNVFIMAGSKKARITLYQYIKDIENAGAGEILINSIDRDGTMEGYDIKLLNIISKVTKIPVIACGGAGSLNDFKVAITKGNANAVAAGSLFVYHGSRRGILINYPTQTIITDLFN